MGKYDYPKNMEEALKLMDNYKIVRSGNYNTTT